MTNVVVFEGEALLIEPSIPFPESSRQLFLLPLLALVSLPFCFALAFACTHHNHVGGVSAGQFVELPQSLHPQRLLISLGIHHHHSQNKYANTAPNILGRS